MYSALQKWVRDCGLEVTQYISFILLCNKLPCNLQFKTIVTHKSQYCRSEVCHSLDWFSAHSNTKLKSGVEGLSSYLEVWGKCMLLSSLLVGSIIFLVVVELRPPFLLPVRGHIRLLQVIRISYHVILHIQSWLQRRSLQVLNPSHTLNLWLLYLWP